jgi:hypothetical protein
MNVEITINDRIRADFEDGPKNSINTAILCGCRPDQVNSPASGWAASGPAAGKMMLPIERHYSPVQNSLLIGFWGFVLTSVKYSDSSYLSTVFQSSA